ncbi:MAG: YqeG family HAD IIIA-type phosphatase [Oscillospiraceae bacterium]|nr:YqeG family HAD IIIA-type phosphatase [Oscillospiraceae bacterium]
MSIPFVPDIITDALTDLTPELLKSRGIDFLMLDFDNTIVPYTQNEPSPEMEAWLMRMRESEIGLCVVSNSKRDRVVKFCASRGIPCITHAKKPFSKGIRACHVQFGFEKTCAALVGDQIYTDVLGANCAGVASILVTPIHLHNIWLKLRHVAEIPFIAMGRRNRL